MANLSTEPAAAPAGAVVETRFLDRPDGRIAFDDRGSGPVVVMVPGLGDVRAEYRFLAAKLVEAGYRAVTMDLRGHGRSSTGWPDHGCAAIGSDVAPLIAHPGAGPAGGGAAPGGAGAAAAPAAAAPEMTAALVLIGPFVRTIPPKSRLKGILQKAMIRIALAGPWAPGVWGSYYVSLYPTAKPADLDDYRSALVKNLGEPGRLAALKAMLAAGRDDIEPRLSEVRAPTLVVMGSKDPDFADPAAEAETVARLLRGTVTMIEGAGHYPHAEMPETTASAVLAFLGREGAR